MGERNWVKRSFPTFLRWTKRGVLMVVAILILSLIVHTVLNAVLHKRVEVKIAEIRETGGAITFSELAPDLHYQGQNAAIHYEYAHSIMMRVLAEEQCGLDRILNAFGSRWSRSMTSQKRPREAKREVGSLRSVVVVRRRFGAIKAEEEEHGPAGTGLLERYGGAEEEYQRGVEAATEYLEKVEPGIEAEGREIELAARHIFKRMEPGLQVLKDARQLKGARMLTDYDIDASARAGLALPYLARMRALSRWVASAAVLEARYGEMNEAFGLISAGLHLANGLREEPMVISQLVRIALGGVGINAMYQILDEGYPPDEHLQEIIAEFDELRDRKYFVRAWQGTRCSATDPRYSIYGVILTTGRVADLLWRPIRLLDALEYLETMDEVIDVAALPTYKSREWLSDLEQRFPPCFPVGRQLTLRPFTSSLSCGQPARVCQSQDRLVSQCDLAEMAIYLKQYKKTTGSYPDELDAIVPEYIQKLPVDPFTGIAYIYRMEGDGFVIYGVGRNLVDDGGKPDLSAGDIVWRSSR